MAYSTEASVIQSSTAVLALAQLTANTAAGVLVKCFPGRYHREIR